MKKTNTRRPATKRAYTSEEADEVVIVKSTGYEKWNEPEIEVRYNRTEIYQTNGWKVQTNRYYKDGRYYLSEVIHERFDLEELKEALALLSVNSQYI